MRRLTTTFALSAALLLLASPVKAGELEADVIDSAMASFVEAWQPTFTSDDMQVWVDDATELFEDTYDGTYCRTYASIYLAWTAIMYDAAVAIEAGELTSASVQARGDVFFNIVYDQIAGARTRCAAEL